MGSFCIMQYIVLGLLIVVCACFQTLQTDENDIGASSRVKRATHPWPWTGNRKPPDKICHDFCGMIFDICNGGTCILDPQTCRVECACPPGAMGQWCQHNVTPSFASRLPTNSTESEPIDNGKNMFSTGPSPSNSQFSSDWKSMDTVSALPSISKNSISPSSFMSFSSVRESITPSLVEKDVSLERSKTTEINVILTTRSIAEIGAYTDTGFNVRIPSTPKPTLNIPTFTHLDIASISPTKTFISHNTVSDTRDGILELTSSSIASVSQTGSSHLVSNNNKAFTVAAQASSHSHSSSDIGNGISPQGSTLDRKELEIQTHGKNISTPSTSHMLNFTINGVYRNDSESLISCQHNCTGGVCLDVNDVVSCVMITDVKNNSTMEEIDPEAFCLPGFACQHGQCDQEALGMNKVKCRCDPNWIGTFCQDRCDLDCGNHGYCAILETVNDTVGCICHWNHTGTRCEILKTFEKGKIHYNRLHMTLKGQFNLNTLNIGIIV